MKIQLLPSISLLLLSAFSFFFVSVGAQEKNAQDDCCQNQAGRVESAKEIIDQSKSFKLNATESSIHLKDAIQRARMLKGETNKLTGQLEKGNIDQYKKNLAAFLEHADKYKAHLAQTEQVLGHCKASEDAYKQQLSSWKNHIDSYHIRISNFDIGSLRPPRVCPGMNVSVGESNQMANSMRTDAQRLILSQQALQKAEDKLNLAVQAMPGADAQVANRSRLLEHERQLSGEFASLKTELELLNTQYKTIAKVSDPKGIVVSKVQAQIKSKP